MKKQIIIKDKPSTRFLVIALIISFVIFVPYGLTNLIVPDTNQMPMIIDWMVGLFFTAATVILLALLYLIGCMFTWTIISAYRWIFSEEIDDFEDFIAILPKKIETYFERFKIVKDEN